MQTDVWPTGWASGARDIWPPAQSKKEGSSRRKGDLGDMRGMPSVLTAAKSKFWAQLWIICHCSAGETFLCRWLCPFLAGSPMVFLFPLHTPHKPAPFTSAEGHYDPPAESFELRPPPSQFEQHFAAALVIQTRFHIPLLGSRFPRKVSLSDPHAYLIFLSSCDDLPFGAGPS